MLIDTHCHINMIIKKKFDVPLTSSELESAEVIIQEANQSDVKRIINVGTSAVESTNCVILAKHYAHCYASIGIHPNDCTAQWHKELKQMRQQWFGSKEQLQEHKIVAIGECGMDKHYPDYNIQRQKDAFKAQIELALEYDLALIVHTRDAADETLTALDEFSKEPLRGVIHCFSQDQAFADYAIAHNFVLGIGGPLTYPKNNYLRDIFVKIPLNKIILETDAPFLPPQVIRGKKNYPKYIATIAQYLADMRNAPLETIAQQTSKTASELFGIQL